MTPRHVVFSPEAQSDLIGIYDLIAAAASSNIAIGYIDRLAAFCNRLDMASERGHRRDDLRPGLRIVGFERRVTIAFSVSDDVVTVLRMFYGGRHWEAEFG